MLGSGEGTQVPSAAEEAQSQIKILREKARLEQEQSKAERERLAAEDAQTISKAQQKQQSGYDLASSYDDRQLASGGYDNALVDKYGVRDLFMDSLDRTRAGFDEKDQNPVFGERTAFNDAIAQGNQSYRRDLGNEFKTFADDGFETAAFGDTADDAVLNSILTGQYDDVVTRVNAARDRGKLNDQGYLKALEKLDTQRKAGDAQLQSLGGGVLAGYRKQLGDYASSQRNRLNGATLNDTFDIGGARTGLEALRTSLGGKLEGDLYNATSGQTFFNPDLIIGYGGAQQGLTNPSAQPSVGGSPLLSAFAPKKTGSTLTGTTGNGVF